MTATTAIGFKKSVYYAFNSLPLVRRCQVKAGSWADAKLNSVFGFQSQAERLSFLQATKPEDVSLGGAAFANFSLALLGTAVSVVGTAAFCFRQTLGWDPAKLGAEEISWIALAAATWLGGGLVVAVTLDNFFERSAILRFSPETSELPLLTKTMKRITLGLSGAIVLCLGERVVGTAASAWGQGLAYHLVAIGFLFMGSQWLHFNADFHRYHVLSNME